MRLVESRPTRELVLVDAKKLGRITRPGHRVTGDRRSQSKTKGKAGWRHLFLAINDHSRVGFAPVYPTRPPTRRLPFSTSSSASTLTTASPWSALSERRLLQAPLDGACERQGIVVKKTRA